MKAQRQCCGFVAVVLVAVPAFAQSRQAALDDMQKTLGFVPGFMKAMPEAALPGVWEEMKSLQLNPSSALPVKYKELIGLAVSAQIPCHYCVYAHTQFARAQGATDQEIGAALSEAALARHWSTFMNGMQLDERRFRDDLGRMVQRMKDDAAAKTAAPVTPITVTNAESAYRDMEQRFGFVPDFLRRFPANGIVGAWRLWRDVELDPEGAVPPKYLALAGLGVAAQVPCRYCVIADTELAKAAGATEAELTEAIAVAAFTRQMSTLLNGLQLDEAAFRADIQRLARPKPKKTATR